MSFQGPSDLRQPTIQVQFRGLFVFRRVQGGQLGVAMHHTAANHKLTALIRTFSGGGSDVTSLPDFARNHDIILDVRNPATGFEGIRKYNSEGSENARFNYSKVFKFRSLPGHSGASEIPAVLGTATIFNHAYFFSLETDGVIKALQANDCRDGEPIQASFVVAANLYVAAGGEAFLRYGPPGQIISKPLHPQNGTTYQVELLNLPPEGMFGHTSHFRFYYDAFSGVTGSRYDICPILEEHHLHHPRESVAVIPPVTRLHPCLSVSMDD